MSPPTPLPTGKPAASSACSKRPMPICAVSLPCRLRWPATSHARRVPPTRDCGPKSRRTPRPAVWATPNAATRAWTKHPITSPPRLPTIWGAITWLSTGQEVSLLTLSGRSHVPDLGWTRHVALLQGGATLGGAKLWYDRSKQRFYLLVSLTIDTPDPTPEQQRHVMGIDVGSRYLATVARSEAHTSDL